MKRPEKEIHTHNSIPGYFDGLDEGCSVCIKNKAIDDFTAFLPSEEEWAKYFEDNFQELFMDLMLFREGPPSEGEISLRLAKAIHKRLT